jgi:hypothetical protein
MIAKSRIAKILISSFIILLFGISTFQIQLVTANSSWSDDFEDQSLDSWIVTRGVFSAEQETLWAYGTRESASNRAYHECNITTGRWSFDILLNQSWHWRYHPPAVRFMVDSLDDVLWQGYVLDFYTIAQGEKDILAIYLRVHSNIWNYLAHYDFDNPVYGWQSVGIQRTSNGRITVYLNNSLIMDVTDNSIEEASYFVFDSEDCVKTVFDPDTHTDKFVKAQVSPMLDNIVVSEIPEIVAANYSTSFVIISSIICGIALLIIAKPELKKIKTKSSCNDELQ